MYRLLNRLAPVFAAAAPLVLAPALVPSTAHADTGIIGEPTVHVIRSEDRPVPFMRVTRPQWRYIDGERVPYDHHPDDHEWDEFDHYPDECE